MVNGKRIQKVSKSHLTLQKQIKMAKYPKPSFLKAILASIAFLLFLTSYFTLTSELFYLKTQATELLDTLFSGIIRI